MSWVRDRHKREEEERRRLRSSLFLAISALTILVVMGTLVMKWIDGWS